MGKKGKWSKQSKQKDTIHQGNKNSSSFLDPSLLAHHAALARRTDVPSSTTKQNDIRTSKLWDKPNKVKKATKHKVESKKRKKSLNINGSPSFSANSELSISETQTIETTDTNYEGDNFVRFGFSKWRKVEQLCHILLFHRLYEHPNLQKQSKNNEKYVLNNIYDIIIVFMEDIETVKECAAIFKPVVYPASSTACHRKLKGNILQSIIKKFLNPHQKNDTNPSHSKLNDGIQSIQQSTDILFCHDDCLSLLLSTCTRIYGTKINSQSKKKKNEKTVPATNQDSREKMKDSILFIHFDPPTSSNISQIRQKTANDLISFYMKNEERVNDFPKKQIPTSFLSPNSTHILLDGTTSDVNGQLSVNGNNKSRFDEFNSFLTLHAKNTKNLSTTISNSDRNIVQAAVNSAMRIYTSDNGSERETAAREKLKAHLFLIKDLYKKRKHTQQYMKNTKTTSTLLESSKIVEPDMKGKMENTTLTIKKMKALGMIHDQYECKSSKNRDLAMTKWLDGAKGSCYGASWEGTIRFGASTDESSKLLAMHRYSASITQSCQIKHCPHIRSPNNSINLYCSSIQTLANHKKNKGKKRKIIKTQTCWYNCALHKWKPNPSNGNPYRLEKKVDDNGSNECSDQVPGAKACGHNETSMFFLRPFASLEVLNSRVCSISSPAPGNDGYEGCLDFLRRMCAESQRGMSVWDNDSFSYIDGKHINSQGKAHVSCLKKEKLLGLSLDHLSWLVKTIRQWLLFREKYGDGCNPSKLLRGIELAVFMVKNSINSMPIQKRSKKDFTFINVDSQTQNGTDFLSILPKNVLRTIMQFVFIGMPEDWIWIDMNIIDLSETNM